MTRALIILVTLQGPLLAVDTINTSRPRIMLTSGLITNMHNHFAISGGGTVCTPDMIGATFLAQADADYNVTQTSGTLGNDFYLLLTLSAAYVALHNLPGDTTDGAACDSAGHTSAAFAAKTVSDYLWLENGFATANCPSGTIAGCLAATPPANPWLSGSPYAVELFAAAYDWLQYDTNQWGSNRQTANQWLQAISLGLQGDPRESVASMCPQGDDIRPNDNECLSAHGTILLASIAMYGDGCSGSTNTGCYNSVTVNGTLLGDNLDRNGAANSGGNSQFDWALNDSTYGARNLFIPYYSAGLGVGGVMYEGKYGIGDMHYLAEIFSSMDVGTNVSFTSLMPNLWSELHEWDEHSTVQSPDLLYCSFANPTCGGSAAYYWLQYSSNGDASYGSNESHRAALVIAHAMLTSGAAQQQIQSYLTSGKALYPAGTYRDFYVFDFIFLNYPNSTASAYSTLNYFANTNCSNPFTNSCGGNWVSTRSNTNGSLSTQFTATCGTSRVRHGTSASCSIFLWRKGRWLLDNIPTYGIGGTFATSEDLTSTLVRQGTSDNNGSGTYMWKGNSQNSVGKSYIDRYENDSGDHYIYFRGQLAASMNATTIPTTYGANNKVTSASRECVFIKSGSYAACADRLVSSENVALAELWQITTSGGDPAPSQAIPTPSVPTVTSSVIASTDVDQTLYITSIYPASAPVSVVAYNDSSGTITDYDDVGFLPHLAYSTGGCFTSNPATSCLDQSFYVRRYEGRVQTASGGATAASPNQWMLTALQADDTNGGIGQTTMSGVTNGSYSGAHIKDSTANWVVGFSNSAAGSTLGLPFSYSYTPTTTTRLHLVTDLAASANVCASDSANTISVSANGGTCAGGATAMTTSAQGTLAFTDTGGILTPGINPSTTTTGSVRSGLTVSGGAMVP